LANDIKVDTTVLNTCDLFLDAYKEFVLGELTELFCLINLLYMQMDAFANYWQKRNATDFQL